MIIETIDVAPATPQGPRRSARLFGSSLLLVRRRAWRDRGPVLASIAIVALASALSLAGPRMVLNTLDDGARDAVDTIGDDANIVVTFPVGNPTGDNVNSVRGLDPPSFDDYAEEAQRNLPGLIAPFVEGYSSSVVSRYQTVTKVLGPTEEVDPKDFEGINPADHPDLWTSRVDTFLHFAMVEDAEWTLVEGRFAVDAFAPSETTAPGVSQAEGNTPAYQIIEICLSESVASALNIELGSVIQTQNYVQSRVYLHVVGIVRASDPTDPVWTPIPEALEGLVIDTPGRPIYRRGTAVVSTQTASVLTSDLEQPFNGTVVLEVDSEGLTLEGTKEVAQAMRALESTAASLIPAPDISVQMTSELAPALEAYPRRAKAALAQMSIMVAGVIAVAGIVVALMARLLLTRRESDIALERARGSSVPSIAIRLSMESFVITLAGVTAGYVVARAAISGEFGTGPPSLVALVSVAALPVLGALSARRMWTSRRLPANRRDRARITRAKKAKRLTLEALAVTLAIAAVFALQQRGLLSMRTSGVDPFLAAAPVLLTLGVTVAVLRLYPIPMILVQAIAKRTRGVAGILTLAKARERMAALPLLSLSLAISVAVSGGLFVSTIQEGQEQASWERVGGDVRIESGIEDSQASALEAEGLTVSRVVSEPYVNVNIGTSYLKVHLLAIDDDYADVVEASGFVEADDLRMLLEADKDATTGEIPALISPQYRALDFTDTREAFIGGGYHDFVIVGDALSVPSGWTDGPFLVMPADILLAEEADAPLAYNLTLVAGDGAEEAVLGLGIDPSITSTRDEWLEGVRESALIGGVALVMLVAAVTVGLLAGIGLLLTVLQGVRERGLALSMLRTQGLSARYGWWLALTELAPLTIAAIAGGTVAGTAILLLLGSTLGLKLLSGGVSTPALQVNPAFLTMVGVGIFVLLIAAVAAEVVAHRRDKLSEVLRLGDTR